MNIRFSICSALLALATLLGTAPSAYAGVLNGDFSIGALDSWTTTYGVAPIDGSGFAQFETTGFTDPLVELEQTFIVPTGALTLSFEIMFSSQAGGTSDPFATFDSFQATLYDSNFDAINPIDAFLLPGFYLLDASGFEESSATGVSIQNLAGGVKRITLDIASLVSQEVTIEFLLLGDDDELATTVILDNVNLDQRVGVVPEPTSFAIWALAGVFALPLPRRRRAGHVPA